MIIRPRGRRRSVSAHQSVAGQTTVSEPRIAQQRTTDVFCQDISSCSAALRRAGQLNDEEGEDEQHGAPGQHTFHLSRGTRLELSAMIPWTHSGVRLRADRFIYSYFSGSPYERLLPTSVSESRGARSSTPPPPNLLLEPSVSNIATNVDVRDKALPATSRHVGCSERSRGRARNGSKCAKASAGVAKIATH